MKNIFIEAESFENLGGWIIETQSFETIHSAYLMAHGMGIPVSDAKTSFQAEEKGEYNVWALTRDWTRVWGVKNPAGQFEIKINGKTLPNTLGTESEKWAWQFAGKICLEKGKNEISLCDKTGFNGRCDAIFITDSDSAPSNEICDIDKMRQTLNYKQIEDYAEDFDLIIVGGGIAGVCTALSSIRSGVKTALISDREVLGGCNSSEVRVGMGGRVNLPPYKNIGSVVREIAPIMNDPKNYDIEYFEDSRKLFAFEILEEKKARHKLFMGYSVTEIEKEGKKIKAVICTNIRSGKKIRICAPLFSDCSGDGVLARKMGCQTMYGREAASEFDESLAPKEAQKLVMGHSIRWYSEKKEYETDFPDIDWNMKFTDENCLNCISGDWEQETGFTRDMVFDIEYIRDYGLRAIYSNWAFQKHHFKDKEKFKNRALKWVSAIGGKREGYRVYGDYVLTQRDLEEKIYHEDETAAITWSIDMHFPEPSNLEEFGEAFRSYAYHRGIEKPYPVPYRCLYARDAENLFIGGRLVSSSHVAFSAIRVMRTLGALGEVAGLASSICKKYSCTPREVYTEHLSELKKLLKKGVPIPQSFGCGTGADESYHFKDIGWWWLHWGKCQQPEHIEKYKRGVKFLSLPHKYPEPKEWKKK